MDNKYTLKIKKYIEINFLKIFLIIGIALRMLRLSFYSEISHDEAIAFNLINSFDFTDHLKQNYSNTEVTNPPLFFIYNQILTKLDSLFFMTKLLPLIVSTCGLYCLYKLIKDYEKKVNYSSISKALFVSFSICPFFITYGTMFLSYSPLFLLTFLQLLLLKHLHNTTFPKKESLYIVLLTLINTVMIYLNYTYIWSFLFIVLLFAFKKIHFKKIKTIVISTMIPLLLSTNYFFYNVRNAAIIKQNIYEKTFVNYFDLVITNFTFILGIIHIDFIVSVVITFTFFLFSIIGLILFFKRDAKLSLISASFIWLPILSILSYSLLYNNLFDLKNLWQPLWLLLTFSLYGIQKILGRGSVIFIGLIFLFNFKYFQHYEVASLFEKTSFSEIAREVAYEKGVRNIYYNDEEILGVLFYLRNKINKMNRNVIIKNIDNKIEENEPFIYIDLINSTITNKKLLNYNCSYRNYYFKCER
jgi:hypothetical protein